MDFAPYLADEYRTSAVKTAYEVIRKNEYRRIADVEPLVLELVELEMYSEAIEILLGSEKNWNFVSPEEVRVLESIASRLPENVLSNLLRNQDEDLADIASRHLSLEQTLEELSNDRSNALRISRGNRKYLIVHLVEFGHADLAIDMFLTVWTDLFERDLADVSIAIAPYVSKQGIYKIFEKAMRIELMYGQRATILEAIVPYMPVPLLQEAIQQSWTIFDDDWRVAAVKRLIHLGYEQEAFASLITLPHTRLVEIESTLAAVASDFSEAFVSEIAERALRNTHWERILAIAHALPDSMVNQCLEKIKHLSYEKCLALVEKILPTLSGQNLFRALEILTFVDDVSARDATLATLIKGLPSKKLSEILLFLPIRGTKFRFGTVARGRYALTVETLIRLAHRIGDDDAELQALAGLAEFLPKEWQEKTLVFASKHELKNSIVPLLFRLEKYLDAAKILEESVDVKGLLGLVERVPLVLKTEVLAAARRAAVPGKSSVEREANLIAIAQIYIELKLPIEAYKTVDRVKDAFDWAEAFATIAEQLLPLCTPEFMEQILHDFDETTEEWPRLIVLASLAPYLNVEKRERILPEIKAKMDRLIYLAETQQLTGLEIRVITKVAPYSMTIQRFIVRLWHAVLGAFKPNYYPGELHKMSSLKELCALFPEEFLEQATVIANSFENITTRALMLSCLYARMAQEQRKQLDVDLNRYYDEVFQKPKVDFVNNILTNLCEALPSRRIEICEKTLVAIDRFLTVRPSKIPDYYFWEDYRKSFLGDPDLAKLLTYLFENGGSAIYAQNFVSLFLSEQWRKEAGTISFCAQLVRFYPVGEQRDLLTRLLMRSGKIENRDDRESALRDIVAQVNRENCPDIRKIFFVPVDWQDRNRVRRSRSELLTELTILLPIIQSELGESGIMELYNAILEVCKWWP